MIKEGSEAMEFYIALLISRCTGFRRNAFAQNASAKIQTRRAKKVRRVVDNIPCGRTLVDGAEPFGRISSGKPSTGKEKDS